MTMYGTTESAPLRQPPDHAAGRLPGNSLHKIFEARVREAPHRIAVSTIDEDLSYGELDRRANQVAHGLRRLAVGPGTLVGLCADRSIDMVVGVLGILKAGGAYVPIDPSYPAKRIRFLLDDSAVPVVVAVRRVASCLSDSATTALYIDDGSELPRDADHPPSLADDERNLAYVIYTSGSTGTPKGVLIEHHNVVRLFEQTQPWFRFDERDVWTMFHSIGFDFSVWEIWGALLYGGRLVIVPYDVSRSAKEFYALVQRTGVTVLNQTPSAFRQLIAEDRATEQVRDLALRLVIFGGEALDLKMLEPWIGRRGDHRPVLVNMYGITETTVHVTYKRITAEELKRPDLSPIGVPIPDLKIHLLDASGQPVADGTPGNIYVSGAGLARGYLNRPELTAERFLDGVGQKVQGRLYNSGDRAVRMPSGELNYLGRADDQIKVRGFRIEPREIEFCLGGHPAVTASVVVPRDYGEGDVRLIAYVVPREEALTCGPPAERLVREITELAATELPLHMRPSAYVLLVALPMTSHGKVDRSNLPLPAVNLAAPDEAPAAPANSIVQALTTLWEEILEVKGIGATDDFFDIGGTSLALARMFGRMSQQFGVSVDFNVLLDGATIERLAACISEELRSGSKVA